MTEEKNSWDEEKLPGSEKGEFYSVTLQSVKPFRERGFTLLLFREVGLDMREAVYFLDLDDESSDWKWEKTYRALGTPGRARTPEDLEELIGQRCRLKVVKEGRAYALYPERMEKRTLTPEDKKILEEDIPF